MKLRDLTLHNMINILSGKYRGRFAAVHLYWDEFMDNVHHYWEPLRDRWRAHQEGKPLTVDMMTRRELLRVRPAPEMEFSHFDSLVLIPRRRMHDSGYRCISAVACLKNVPLARVAWCSDVIHLDGIGGWGQNWLKKYGTVPHAVPPIGWMIDFLPLSGLPRLFTMERKMLRCDSWGLSSFEIFTEVADAVTETHGQVS